MLSTTHTSTDPSFSSATYVPEDSESVGTVIGKIMSSNRQRMKGNHRTQGNQGNNQATPGTTGTQEP